MRLKDYMLGMIIIGAFVLCISGFMNTLANDYYGTDLEQDKYNITTFSKVNTIFNDWNKTAAALEQIKGTDEETEYPDYLPKTFKRIKDIIFGSANAVGSATKGIVGTMTLGFTLITGIGADIIGIPHWVINVLLAGITILIVLILTKVLTGRDI